MSPEPHVLVIEIDGNDQELSYRVECPGVTDHCQMWEECQPCNADEEVSESLWDTDGEHHEQVHQYIGDLGWSLPVDQCFVTDNDNLTEAAQILAEQHHLIPGRYPVSFAAEEGVYLHLDLLEVHRVA